MSLAFIPDHFSHGDYGFQKAGVAQLPLVERWLTAPHLVGWWVPDQEALRAALTGENGQAAYLVDHQGMAFAFLYMADPAHDPDLTVQLDYLKGAVCFDQFIGDGEMIGHGHGVKFIKSFVAAMKSTLGVTRLLALPEKNNLFAQRTYSQAGLRTEKPFNVGGRDCLLMSLPVV